MKYKHIIMFLLTVAFLTACTKELDIDYQSIDPKYVVEAYVTNEGMRAMVTKTQDVKDGGDPTTVDDAQLFVSGSDGTTAQLMPLGKGRYASSAHGKTGVTYTLTATMGETTASAVTTMQDSTHVVSSGIRYLDLVGNLYYQYEISVEDDGLVDRDYYIAIYRNGEPYSWDIYQNKESDGGILNLYYVCFCYNEDADADDREDWLLDGDTVTAYVSRIDETSYDYYASWSTTGQTFSNPHTNMSNGVLGLFSAQYITRLPAIVFERKTIKPSE